MSELTEEQKQVFKDAAARRREAGIRLKRFCVMLEENQVISVNEYWDTWVRHLGKVRAGDYLLVVMREAHEKLRAALVEREAKKRGKK